MVYSKGGTVNHILTILYPHYPLSLCCRVVYISQPRAERKSGSVLVLDWKVLNGQIKKGGTPPLPINRPVLAWPTEKRLI